MQQQSWLTHLYTARQSALLLRRRSRPGRHRAPKLCRLRFPARPGVGVEGGGEDRGECAVWFVSAHAPDFWKRLTEVNRS
jgi:hypothetical protein